MYNSSEDLRIDNSLFQSYSRFLHKNGNLVTSWSSYWSKKRLNLYQICGILSFFPHVIAVNSRLSVMKSLWWKRHIFAFKVSNAVILANFNNNISKQCFLEVYHLDNTVVKYRHSFFFRDKINIINSVLIPVILLYRCKYMWKIWGCVENDGLNSQVFVLNNCKQIVNIVSSF